MRWLIFIVMLHLNVLDAMNVEMQDMHLIKDQPRVTKGIIGLDTIKGKALYLYDRAGTLLCVCHYEGGTELNSTEKKDLSARYNVNNFVIQDTTKPQVEQPLSLLSFFKVGGRLF